MAKITFSRAQGPARTIKTAPSKNKGFGKGKGQATIAPHSKGNGKGQGQWVWMPQAAVVPAPVHHFIPMGVPYGRKGKGKGKTPQVVSSMGKAGKRGKGGAKGGAQFLGIPKKPLTRSDKIREKLRKVEASKKVWVGNLSKKTTWKQLEKHFSDIAKPTVVDVNEKKGTGVVCFGNEDDASSAIAVLNGSELEGEIIEVDVWTKPEREPKEGAEKKKRVKVKKVSLTQVTAKQSKMAQKIKEKLKDIDDSLKIWIGGLSPKTTWKKLSEHLEPVAKPSVVDLMEGKGKGKAVAAFDDIAHVEEAIATLNDTELDGKTIKVDVWKKPEKKEKKEKTD